MRTTLRNLIIDYLRQRIRQPQRVALDDQHPDKTRSPLERVLSEEQIALYDTALTRLKPRDAALVTLKIDEQLSYDEIAAELGLASGNAARVAARRAVLRLAHEMAKMSQAKDESAMRDAS
jgi:RNA polymerase sigma factor (sigma-70 family)